VVVERDPDRRRRREPLPVSDRVRRGLADRQGLEDGLAPEPVLELREYGRGFGAAQLSDAFGLGAAASIVFVERADVLERDFGLRVVGLGLVLALSSSDDPDLAPAHAA